MSWYCKCCETYNEDSDDSCVVCDAIPPVLTLSCGTYYEGFPLTIKWKDNSVDRLHMRSNGVENDVTGLDSCSVEAKAGDDVVFIAENAVATREFVFIVPPPRLLAKYCTTCGHEFVSGDRYCTKCGIRR